MLNRLSNDCFSKVGKLDQFACSLFFYMEPLTSRYVWWNHVHQSLHQAFHGSTLKVCLHTSAAIDAECAKVLAPAAVSEKPLDLEHAGASLRSGQQLHKLSVVLHCTLTQPDLQQETHPGANDGVIVIIVTRRDYTPGFVLILYLKLTLPYVL